MSYGRLNTFKAMIAKAPLLALVGLLFSCQEVIQSPAIGGRTDAANGSFANTGKGLIYEVNPIAASGNKRLGYTDMSEFVSARTVTHNPRLETPCWFEEVSTTGECFKVLNDRDSSAIPLQSKNGGWNYAPGTDEFYQVNTFYHAQKLFDRFFEGLSEAQANIYQIELGPAGNRAPPATKYGIKNTRSFWRTKEHRDSQDPTIVLGLENTTLTIYSKCYHKPLNAYFDPAENAVCLGWNEERPWHRIAQDPSVIYHELGHALVKVMMNQRNVSRGPAGFNVTPFESDLGRPGYEEAGALNEGIADWFSYYVTDRKHFGEWGLGRFHNSSRAMSEDDEIYNGLVSKRSGERLSYPQYLYFDPNRPESRVESIHLAGQIVSHYLTSLTEEFKSCSVGASPSEIHKSAGNKTLLLLNETLAELGDMTARGSDIFDLFRNGSSPDLGAFFANLNNQESYLWGHIVNPPNYRKFFQTFAKNIRFRIIEPGLCPGFTLDESERLLDEYGLLLFNNYGLFKKGVSFKDKGTYVEKKVIDYNSYFDEWFTHAKCSSNPSFPPAYRFCPVDASEEDGSPFGERLKINSLNRRHTVMVSKDFLEHPINREGVTPTFIMDGRQEMDQLISNLTFEGKGVNVSEGSAGVEYNNNNIAISPGEVVGIVFNLFNNSNSIMGGVQILANDWDHMKLVDPNKTYVRRSENSGDGLETATWAPCRFDGWPNTSENGAVDGSGAPQEGDCGYVTRDNFVIDSSIAAHPRYYQDAPQPVCMVQYSAENETQWVSQDFHRRVSLDLVDDHCLNPPAMSGDQFNPNECLIRFLPGADQALLGRIDPQKSYTETLAAEQTSDGLVLSASAALVMEVNKRIAPGTTFMCRLRARFTNCSDCFENPDTKQDYADYEMAGPEPFKLFNFKFTVVQ